MRQFLDENFLLTTNTAIELYHSWAASMPIFDYHCHLPPAQIAENHRFAGITDIWLGGDHYKWRVMRANGVPEELITGNGDDWDKFSAWAATVPRTVGNPLYQWTHLELRRYFGIDTLVNPDTSREIYDKCNALLASDDFRVRRLMKKMNVRAVCTTDDPADDLEHHIAVRESEFEIRVYPAYRPDKAFQVDRPDALNQWLDRLERASDVDIGTIQDLLTALEKRMDFFHEMGCRISDHGISVPFGEGFDMAAVNRVFTAARRGTVASPSEHLEYASAVMYELGKMYAARNWTFQLHLGALRNNNAKMFKAVGPDTGYDSIGDFQIAAQLTNLLDRLDGTDELPRTILYSLNPNDNEVLAAALGSFQGGVPGKMQLGTAWWYNDQRDGMEKQMTVLANIGLLSRFVGMVTDSRSFLSYPRHEYFRRVLCDLVGSWVERGEAPNDMSLVGPMVQDVSYNNAVNYFGLEQ
ncbi:MAG: glucuronate isomerase [Spirochaetales bacterium]|nr:glucuronate isomerase [Spirochaetales bacterium]